MKLQSLIEPELEFGTGKHVCPRAGIAGFDVFDSIMNVRRDHLWIGAIGVSDDLDALETWITRCQRSIPAKINAKQSALFPAFCGFNRHGGFRASMSLEDEITRCLAKAAVREVAKKGEFGSRVAAAVQLFVPHVTFLSQNRTVDVIICVIPDGLYDVISKRTVASPEDQVEDYKPDDLVETNFRRALKAASLHLGVPLQLIRAKSLESNPPKMQDDATKAWNFCTALYYKANQTVPWRLPVDPNVPRTCYAGISFFRSRDARVLHTSLAQIFDELGNGVILRGTPVDVDKDDRRPFLRPDQAEELLERALDEYKVALGHSPARLVLHRTSKVRPDELEGFQSAAVTASVSTLDCVTIYDTDLRLFRDGLYPPPRGTLISLANTEHLLYTRGSVQYYQTYPGLYVPQPLRIATEHAEASPKRIAEEILSLTKMNWNNTQFDGKYPITLHGARQVGDILKYLDEDERPPIRYSYYM